jgi:hypothetical protein
MATDPLVESLRLRRGERTPLRAEFVKLALCAALFAIAVVLTACAGA